MHRPYNLSAPRFFAAGLVALDVLRITDTPERISFRAGGTAGNVAAILGALGWPAELAGPSDDSLAYTLMRDDLQLCGVQYHGVHRAAVPVIVEELAKCAEHRFLFDCPSCGRALPRYRRAQEVLASGWSTASRVIDVFFADRLSDEIMTMADIAKKHGAFVVYEPSDSADEPWTGAMLAMADMVKYSAERASALAWLTKGDYLEIRTQGARGLQWRWPKQQIARWQSMDAVSASRVVDTCGAGDWLTSGILIGLLEQMRSQWGSISALERILSNAQQLAAWSCGYAGARGGLYESGPSVARAVVQPGEPSLVVHDPLPEPSISVSCAACPD
ncbi:PfkB family carbohydrate kinase [Pinirhizobacter soli]|uniref:PfkB family carbohydrate kinase n=1 Tax=Pinirhizobacter soli TaxID=2786953 RepID=UPI00202A0AC4|nr:PfkB family carbohydrate kinase [Pinirhizobacter soli]